jgi:hypothetical protein
MLEGAVAPLAATGWNLYGSVTAGNSTRQNTTPLPIGSTWQLPTDGLIAGANPINGQQPNFYITLSREIQRG